MRSAIKRGLTLILTVLLLLSSEIFSFAAVTADAVPGTVKLELNETEEGITLDVYLLNISSFSSAEINLSYNTEDLYYQGYDHHLSDPSDSYYWYSISNSSGHTSAEIEFYESTDLHLYTYFFARHSEILFKGADFTVEITTFFNETDSYTSSATVSLPKEKIDPEKYPNALKSGDIDGDGAVDSVDARYALRIAVGLDKCTALVKQYADVDSDKEVSASDARILLRTAVGLDKKEDLPYFLPPETSAEDSWYYYPDITYHTVTEGESKPVNNVLIRKGTPTKWTSSNPACVTVDANGKITALKKGFSCVILECGNEKFYFEITVKSTLQGKIEALKEKYPDGYYWNKHTPSTKYPLVTETPCSDHKEKKYAYCKGQCSGFADMLYSEVFPNAKRTKGVTWETVKIGDYIRFKRHHSVFVTNVVNEGDIVGYDYWSGENYTASHSYIEVAHCNWYSCCNIQWDYYFDSEYEIDSSLSYTAY